MSFLKKKKGKKNQKTKKTRVLQTEILLCTLLQIIYKMLDKNYPRIIHEEAHTLPLPHLEVVNYPNQ